MNKFFKHDMFCRINALILFSKTLIVIRIKSSANVLPQDRADRVDGG